VFCRGSNTRNEYLRRRTLLLLRQSKTLLQ
jgi:hypothetical protein